MLVMSFQRAERVLTALQKHGETELAMWLEKALNPGGGDLSPLVSPRDGPREVLARADLPPGGSFES